MVVGHPDAPNSLRTAITFFGKRNVGKSSLINFLTEQEVALVSDHPGMTTDPVKKAMEILPIGPVLITDTAGLDDEGEIGRIRVQKTLDTLLSTDIAIMVFNAEDGIAEADEEILTLLHNANKPIIAVINKVDLKNPEPLKKELEKRGFNIIVLVSTSENIGFHELKEAIIQTKGSEEEPTIMGMMVNSGDTILLVTPIDTAAPKGRMILPQVMAIRDILDKSAVAVVTKETELKDTLFKLKDPPSLVVTDSQAIGLTTDIVREYGKNIPLTTFSILLAVQKLGRDTVLSGIEALKKLPQNPKVLIAEGCTHHKQKDDIGSVKIPNLLKKMYGSDTEITFVHGGDFPSVESFDVVIHCGACTLSGTQMKSRAMRAKSEDIPIINYGIFLTFAANKTDDVTI